MLSRLTGKRNLLKRFQRTYGLLPEYAVLDEGCCVEAAEASRYPVAVNDVHLALRLTHRGMNCVGG
jgi:hypothetical protein